LVLRKEVKRLCIFCGSGYLKSLIYLKLYLKKILLLILVNQNYFKI
jgi:hypothetical protein